MNSKTLGTSALVRGIFIVLLSVLPGSHKVCGAQEKAFDDAEMTRYITAEMRTFNIPGAAVGIVHNGRIEYLRGFGPADDGGRPITPQTPFLIGSNSKSFTALGVMQLVESGRVDLDKPVQEYLPWFRLKDVEASKKITVRQLLNQTSGLYDSTTPFDEYVAKLGEVRLARPPDQGYEYSDHNYEILGILIEQLSHESYATYMREHVLNPLEMRATYVTYDDAVTNGLAGGHQYLFGLTVSAATSRYAPHDVAAGYIATSAEDMCHYLIAQQNGGVYRGASVVSPASLAEMHRPRTDVDSDYGMGWFIESWNGHESINHMGMNANFSSMINLLPEKGYGVVILTDVNSFSVLGKTNLMDGVIRRIYGQERIGYWPEELLVRLLLLIALLIGFAELLHRLWQLRKFRYLSLPRLSTKVALPLVFGVALVMVLLVAIPYYADATLEDMFELQPDMGYGLVSLAILCLVNSLINAAVRSQRSIRWRFMTSRDPPAVTLPYPADAQQVVPDEPR